MVAERSEITSLRRPPDGWEMPASREQRLAWLAAPPGGIHPKRAYTGPRPDATPTDSLPSFPAGSTGEPRQCSHCGSRFLHREPPMGDHQRGMISCGRCGRQVCWLSASLDRASVAPIHVVPPPLRASVSIRFERLNGCGPACGSVYGHDAATHEAYGREMALASVSEDRLSGIIVIGPLRIDTDAALISVHDKAVVLSPIESGVLMHLAANLGRVCSHEQIVRAVWGQATADVWRGTQGMHGAWHPLRVGITRLRNRLGDAGSLIENRAGLGYLLREQQP